MTSFFDQVYRYQFFLQAKFTLSRFFAAKYKSDIFNLQNELKGIIQNVKSIQFGKDD